MLIGLKNSGTDYRNVKNPYLWECKLNCVSERAYGSCFAVCFFYW